MSTIASQSLNDYPIMRKFIASSTLILQSSFYTRLVSMAASTQGANYPRHTLGSDSSPEQSPAVPE
jgi:hypothetical protein